MADQLQAFFLPCEGGQRFCLYHPPRCTPVRGLVLYVHPFAEEMNKVRRMAALQARALSAVGLAVLQIDLAGCGDSSGDFGDATWDGWVNDVVLGCQWLRGQAGASGMTQSDAPLWLWGLRAGCLLAVEAAKHLQESCNFLFWQPQASGKPVLQQFLRLKVASDILTGESRGLMQSMRAKLANGSAVEVAGYELSAELASGLEQSLLKPPASGGPPQRLHLFEVSAREEAALSPASSQTVTQWEHAGYSVASQVVRGSAFWQTTEIEEAPALIAATTNELGAWCT